MMMPIAAGKSIAEIPITAISIGGIPKRKAGVTVSTPIIVIVVVVGVIARPIATIVIAMAVVGAGVVPPMAVTPVGVPVTIVSVPRTNGLNKIGSR